MTEKTDAVIRFLDFIDRFRSKAYNGHPGVSRRTDGHVYLGYAVCACLERDPEDRPFTFEDQHRDYVVLLNLCTEAEKHIDKISSERAIEKNRRVIQALTGVFRANTVLSISDTVISSLNIELIERLRLISENFAHEGEEPVIPNEDINKIIVDLDKLITFIQESSISINLKDVLLRTLGTLRMELTRVNIVGPDLVTEQIDKLMGQSLRALGAPGTAEQHADGMKVLTSAVVLAEKVGKLLDFGQKAYPVIEKGAELLKQLPF